MSENKVSRRKFLKTGCLAGAGIGLALCGGGTLAATVRPAIDQPIRTLGGSGNGGRILIAYATKAGSTAEISVKMGERLAAGGKGVDVLPLAKVSELSAYRAVVLGSAIRTGHMLPEAQAFVTQNGAALGRLAFSTFIVCMTLSEDTPANRQTVSAYLEPLRAVVRPASEGLFAGVMDLNKLTLAERLIILAMKTPQGDFRNWAEIKAWADALPLG